MDRESIERSDFPLVRRGYDPAAVDAHLRVVAGAAQELSQRAASTGAEPSLGSAAATRVQGILEAAQTTAAEIEREAQHDAQRTREEAAGELERARAHVETLARAAVALLAQVQSLDSEVSTLARSLRTEGASREYASQQDVSQQVVYQPAPAAEGGETSPPSSVPAVEGLPEVVLAPASAQAAANVQDDPPATPARPDGRSRGLVSPAPSVASPVDAGKQRGEDLDGARLVALNMALSGESREQTDRYLADSFQLSDRAKLLDEVYTAVES
jgi:DivIVA domain-containing protein